MNSGALGELRTQSAHVAARAEILDVRYEHLQADLECQPDRKRGFSYELHRDVTLEIGVGGSFVVRAKYEVTVRHRALAEAGTEATEPGKEDPVAEIRATIAALFRIDPMRADETEITTSDIEAYAQSTGLFALHPYARECIRDLAVRLSLPPLSIGVLQIESGGIRAPSES